MALSIAITGTQHSDTTASTTYSRTVGGFGSSNTYAVLVVAYDNQGTNGADPYVSIADSAGNAWARLSPPGSILYDPGAAGAGIAAAIFGVWVPGLLAAGTTITVTFSVAVTAKASSLKTIGAPANKRPKFKTGGVSVGSASAAPTVTTTSIAVGNFLLAAYLGETNVAVTADADVLNGAWANTATAVADTTVDATSVRVHTQNKIPTGAGAQTFNPTTAAAKDCLLAWVEFEEQDDLKVPAGNAAGTGSAGDPGASVKPNAANAAGSGSALLPATSILPNAGAATGIGAAQTPTASVKVNAEVAAGTGQALQPSVSTAVVTNAPAGLAAGTGAALQPSVSVRANAGLASGVGVALQPSVLAVAVRNAPAGLAAGTGSAPAPAVSIKPNAGLAAGTGQARTPTASVKANAGLASGSGQAYQPTVVAIPNRNAPAGLAAGTGAAGSPKVSIRVNAGVASGVGTAQAPSVTAVMVPVPGVGVSTLLAPVGNVARLVPPAASLGAWYFETPGDIEHWNDDNQYGQFFIAQSFDLGVGALKATQTAQTDVTWPYSPYTGVTTPAYPGVVHTERFRLHPSATLRNTRLGFVWLSAPGVEVARSYGPDVALVAGVWNEVTFSAVAPPGTKFVCIQAFYMTNLDTPVPNGESFYMDLAEVAIPTAPTGAELLPEDGEASLVFAPTNVAQLLDPVSNLSR